MLFSTLSLEAMESCLVCEFRGNRTELIHHLRSRHGDLKNQKEFPGFVKDGDIISKDGRYLCLNCMIPRFAKKHKCFGMPEIPRPPPQEDTDSDTSEEGGRPSASGSVGSTASRPTVTADGLFDGAKVKQ
ncbi:hypothetical protein EBZ38_08315 [bacterium]|nr:hypothetical protein [bacterium]